MSSPASSLGKPSFINLFLGNESNIGRSNRGMKLVVPKKSKKLEVGAEPTTSPTAEPATAPAPAATTPPPAAAEAAVGTAVTETEKAAASVPPAATPEAKAWTGVEDAILVGMKTQGKSWKEMQEALPTKSKNDLKQRSKELNLDDKGKGKEILIPFAEGSGQGKRTGKKGILKGAGGESDLTEDEGIDDRGLPRSDVKGKKAKKTGTLKIIEVDSDDEEPADLRGRPIVYMDPESGLSEAHMKILYKLTRKNDELKWLEIASRFFDKTGKRIEPDMLKHMLRNL